jgi:hypothetical protein
MSVAQGINTTVARVAQSALGSPGSTGSALARRVTLSLNKQSETYASQEIASHQQSTGATEGPSGIQGTLNGEVSAGTYQIEIETLLRKAAAATTAITSASLTIAASGSNYTVTRAAGSWLSDGIKVGDVIRLSVGTLAAANISRNLLVLDVGSATVLTVTPLNTGVMTAEGPITGCTVTVIGKKSWTPTSGHLNRYLSYEKAFTDLTRYELFTDVKVGSADIAIPSTGIATVNFGLVGLARALSGSQTLTSPTAESTSAVLAAVQGKCVVNGVVTSITGAQLQIGGNVSLGAAEVGSNSRSDLQRGRVSVSGSFTAKFSAVTLQTLRDNQTAVTLIFVLADSATDAADFISITLPAVKIFTDDADDGEKEIIRSYNFTAQYYGSGGAAVKHNATIVQVQDSQFA